jgi:hypothetical protein
VSLVFSAQAIANEVGVIPTRELTAIEKVPDGISAYEHRQDI